MASTIVAFAVVIAAIAGLVYLARRQGWRRALLLLLEVVAGVLLVTLLFYLYDKIK